MKRTRARHGYLLVEVIFWIALLTTFAVVADHLFVRTFRVIHDADAQTESATRFDAAMQQLRADVGNARAAETTEANALFVHASTGDVRWSSDGKRSISRIAGEATSSWDIGEPIAFAMDGQIVLVRSNAGDLPLAPNSETP
jgi:hypothetical protein